MSGTKQTIPNLYTTWGDSGAAARDTPAVVRNLIATMEARTGGPAGGGSFVRVTDPEFNGGADPTGVGDSTIAFQQAMAAGPCIVPSYQSDGVTVAKYAISNCIVPSGAVLIGGGASVYGADTPSWTSKKAIIIPTSGATTLLFNVNGSGGIIFQGLTIDATVAASTCDGISGGGQNITFRDMSFNFCNRGLGAPQAGSVATFPTGTWICKMFNCHFYACLAGSLDMIDGFVFGGSFTACSNGFMPIITNSGPVAFMGTRFEECGIASAVFLGTTGYGINTVGSELTCCGCTFDGNGNGGVLLASGSVSSLFNGCIFTRNGCNVTGGTTLIANSCHIEFGGTAGVGIIGCGAREQSPDNIFGVYAPVAFAHFDNSTTNTGIVIEGSDISNYQGSTAGATQLGPKNVVAQAAGAVGGWATGTGVVLSGSGVGLTGVVIRNNFGTGNSAQDIDTRSLALPLAKFTSINVTTGSLAAGNITGASDVTLLSTNATPGAQLVRSAANMLTDLNGVDINYTYNLRIINTGAGTFTLTTDAGATVTLTGTMTVPTNTSRDFIVTFTSATAATIRTVGTGTYS